MMILRIPECEIKFFRSVFQRVILVYLLFWEFSIQWPCADIEGSDPYRYKYIFIYAFWCVGTRHNKSSLYVRISTKKNINFTRLPNLTFPLRQSLLNFLISQKTKSIPKNNSPSVLMTTGP
ncbi:unnamed protein product [Chrysodeixis includens]|uniref:Uncharacterized protein n=1 Tax=Chrysodeixis includens TaxID=689277 RepID=A0A9P0FWG8_CHRIL|nr:unnamed protein product [Chrysodeixis includens]